jgi:hypothetical protein
MTDVTVTVDGVRYPVRPERRLTFGRGQECDIRLDPTDDGISRLAGSVEFDGCRWSLINRSRTRNFVVVDETRLRKVVGRGQIHALSGRVTVLVEGAHGTHALTVDAPRFVPEDTGTTPAGLPTSMGEGVHITENDRRALVAMFAGYLADPPDYDPHPRSYEAAAARLGWPRTTLVKRIEYLRTRYKNAGVPNLHGPTALAGLAEHVITAGVVTKADLALVGLRA